MINFRLKPCVLAMSCALVTACGGNSSADIDDIVNTIAPTVNVGEDVTVDEQTAVTLTATASDDGTVTGVAWQQTAGVNVELSGAQSESITFTSPTVIENQTLTFTFTAIDNDGASTSDSVDVTVLPVNALPIATIADTPAVLENVAVSVQAQASDSDGEVVSYSWQQFQGTAVELNGADSSHLTFTTPQVVSTEVLAFVLTVTDNEGGQNTAVVDVTVVGANQAPRVTLLKDLWVEQQSAVTLSSQYSSEVEVVGFNWTQTSGPVIEIADMDSFRIDFTAPSVAGDEIVLAFDLQITDARGLTAHDDIELVISDEQMNTFNGQAFNASERILWERDNQWVGYQFQSSIDIGHARRGGNATIFVPYLAAPAPVELVRSFNDKLYLQDTVMLVPDDNVRFFTQNEIDAPADLNVEDKTTIYQDFNGDGYIDLMVYSNTQVDWYRGDQNGGYSAAQSIIAGLTNIGQVIVNKPSSVGAGAVLVQSDNGQLNLFSLPLASSESNFTAIASFEGIANSSDWSVDMADLDGDSDQDVAATYVLDGKLLLAKLAFNDSDLLLTYLDRDVHSTIKCVVSILDINNDTQQDIVVLADNSDVFSYRHTAQGYVKQQQISVQDPENTFKAIKALPIDINRDGFLDWVVLREVSYFGGRTITHRLNALINNNDGVWHYGEDITFVEDAYANQFKVDDIDGDGFEDVVVLNDYSHCSTCVNMTITQSGDISWFSNNGSLMMDSKKVISYPAIYADQNALNNKAGAALHILDINGDGLTDVAHSYQSDSLVINGYLRN